MYNRRHCPRNRWVCYVNLESIERITGHQLQGLVLGPHHHRPFLPSAFPLPHDAHLVLRGQDPLTLRLPSSYQGNFPFSIAGYHVVICPIARYLIRSVHFTIKKYAENNF